MCAVELQRAVPKFSRTLARVAFVRSNNVGIWCRLVIPAWSSSETIEVSWDEIPESVRSVVRPGKRLHVYVNLEAKRKEDLCVGGWEKC